MQKMEDILSKHERRYAFDNRTTYFDHSHIGLWELKAYAYDYYFFSKKTEFRLTTSQNPKNILAII